MSCGIKLVFRAEKDICAETITVYSGPLGKGEAAEVRDSAVFLEGASAGEVFSYKLTRKGCYAYSGVVEFTEEDERTGQRVIFYRLDRRRGADYEAAVVCRWTEAVEEKLFGLEQLRLQGERPAEEQPDTPAFSGERAAHQVSSLDEVWDYLQTLCVDNGFMSLFNLGGGRGREKEDSCPVAVFSEEDLSRTGTLSEALDKISRSRRIKAVYQAQLHGNEPASGEGALAVIKSLADQSKGMSAERLTQKMDIVIIPHANVIGSRAYARWESGKLDLNRDALLLRSETTRAVHGIFNILKPEVFIDGHEFSGRKRQTRARGKGYVLDSLDDILITCVDHLNRDSRVFEIENQIMLAVIDFLREEGFRSFFFPGSFANNTSCGYARQLHCLAFLVESNGIKRGRLNYERRVFSQREAVLKILSMSAEKAEAIGRTVAAVRADFIQRGKSYDPDRVFVTDQKASPDLSIERPRESFDFQGKPLEGPLRMEAICNRGEAVRTVIRPTAYILPADAKGADLTAEILEANGADCFKSGAGDWVFPMNQLAANLIAASFEPGAEEGTGNVSFVQAGILGEDGKDPVQRYTGSLDRLK